jgi:RNA recognition motif-containing protein
MFLGSLPWQTGADELRRLLDTAAGSPVVVGVRLAKNKETGRPRGFAHVDIEHEQADVPSRLIQALNDMPFEGRLLKVDLAPIFAKTEQPAARPPKPAFQVAHSDTTYTLFVAGMPWKTVEAEIRDLVEEAVGHATVSDVRFMVDRATGRIKGYGYVDVACEADALKAIQALDGFQLEGRRLLVNSDMKNKQSAV